MIFKTTSHRSREKLSGIIGPKPQYLYRFDKPGNWVDIQDHDKIERAKKVKGVTVARDQNPEAYLRCWNWGLDK